MQRYWYILIWIDVCFSKNFIDNNGKYVKRHVGKVGHREKYRDRLQFDLAEFVRTEKSDVDFEIGHEQSHGNYMSIGNAYIKDDNDYLNVKENDYELNKNLKDLLSIENKNNYEVTEKLVEDRNEVMVNNAAIHNTEKKCAFKHMKIPFFSHSPSTTKSRKTKKKKITKDDNAKEVIKKEITDSKYQRKNSKINKKKSGKRNSNKCMQCATKEKNMIHNSRQYFENKANEDNTETSSQSEFKTSALTLTKKEISDFDYDGLGLNEEEEEEEVNIEDDRKKRDDKENMFRRQKEIDELQRQIDGVKIDTQIANTTGH